MGLYDDLYILDEHHNVVPEPDMTRWSAWFKSSFGTSSRRVAEDFAGPYRISTIFLAVDHRFTQNIPPLVFETMIFGPDGTEHCERCSTWDEALSMHQRGVAEAEKLNTR